MSSTKLQRLVLASLLPCLGVTAQQPTAAPPEFAAETQLATEFVRVKLGRDGEPIALQTAVARYAPASGDGELTVDLIAAVHIGQRAYYGRLNKRFERYNVVLYELVAPHDRAVPRPGRGGELNLLRIVQQVGALALDLDFQLDSVDYTKPNFVHADLSPEEMLRAIQKRGDDGFTLALSITADILRQYNLDEMAREEEEQRTGANDRTPTPLDPLSFLLDPAGPAKLKRRLAEELVRQATGAGLGKTLETILVDDRNKAAMRVFQRELAKGTKRIAIFYGAAHMPDFERRLTRDFGLKRTALDWRTAWDLRLREITDPTRILELLRKF